MGARVVLSLDDQIVTEVELGSHASAKERISLVCAGGLLTSDKDFYEQFVLQLRRKRDVFDPVRLNEPASLGALALGQEAEALAQD